MKPRILYSLIALLILFSCGKQSGKSYPNADAVYLKWTKTYRLNRDGSIHTIIEKQHKLLTYRAFQSLYGDTHIFYNPDFQKVEIQYAFTVNADGTKIEVPENGVNDILPGWAAGSKTYSRLREKVITHTGLEQNATINCRYSVVTQPDVVPFLAGIETIGSDCPIEELSIVVELPEEETLNYQLVNASQEPQVKTKDGMRSYRWNFTDLPQKLHENYDDVIDPTVPVLAFSTQKDAPAVKNWLNESVGYSAELVPEAIPYLTAQTVGLESVQQILKIQEIVVGETNTLNIPTVLLGFRSRNPQQVWLSGSGTPFEKSALLASLLRSFGYAAELCLQYPAFIDGVNMPFFLMAEPLVKVETDGQIMLLSATHRNSNDAGSAQSGNIVLSLQSDFKQINTQQPTRGVRVTGEMLFSGDNLLKGKITSEYSHSAIPYYRLLADKNLFPDKNFNINGKADSLSANFLSVSSQIETKDWTVQRGDYIFVRLPESKEGLTAVAPAILPFERETPLKMSAPVSESYQYSIVVPDNMKLVNGLNEDVTNAIGHVRFDFGQDGNTLKLIRTVDINKEIISPEEYALFKQLLDKWHTPKFREIILKKE